MKFSTFFNPIAGAFRAAVLKLSSVDGQPGLTMADFTFVLNKVKDLNVTTLTNDMRAKMLAEWIRTTFGNQLPQAAKWSWVPSVIGWVAVQVAKRVGLIP